jgi:excisionase family DNA binding protein
MPKITLQQAAQVTGVSYPTLKKHAQRGKLRTQRGDDGRSIVVDESDLEAYMAVEHTTKAMEAATGEPMPVYVREIGNVIQRLPNKVIEAILAGMPVAKPPKAGSSAPFLRAIEDIPRTPPGPEAPADDPHFGYPIGYQHRAAPRWKRSSASTWSLDGASWSWNGLFWEGGGVHEGRNLEDGFSPANPDSVMRPLSPARPAGTGKAAR